MTGGRASGFRQGFRWGINVPSKRHCCRRSATYRSNGLASQARQTKVDGGPMTVVAGIVALLLLGYLVVALLKPERF